MRTYVDSLYTMSRHVGSQAQVSIKPFTPGDLDDGTALFTITQLHTHATSTTSSSCLRHLRHDTYATRKLRQYFELGLAPKQASVSLDADLWRLAEEHAVSPRDVVTYHKALASNRYYRLPRAAVTSLYTRWRNTTSCGEEIADMEAYEQAMASATAWCNDEIQEYRRDHAARLQRDNPPSTTTLEAVGETHPEEPPPSPPPFGFRGVQLTPARWAVVLVPPLAARYAIEAPQSREIIFADASASLATFAVTVVTLYTSVCGAAAPLGFMIVTAMDEELLAAGFRQFQNVMRSLPPPRGGHTLPEVSDSVAWQTGPTLFMSDAEQALRNAWRAVFPGSRQLLCHWHLLRAVWMNLYKHTRDRDILIRVFTKFREMVYSETRENFVEATQAFENTCLVDGLHGFMEYINRQWMREVEAWALYPRLKISGWRGHNTNNVCESQFAIMKDFIFGRVRMSSYPRLIDRLGRCLMDWYQTTLFDRIFDDKLHRMSRYRLSRRSTGRKEKIYLCMPVPRVAQNVWDEVEPIDGASTLYIVGSSSRRGHVHVADLSAAMCSCEQGMSGRICSHQVVAWQKYSESEAGRDKPNPFMYPKWSADDKALFYYIATGRYDMSLVHTDEIIRLCGELQPDDDDSGDDSGDDGGDDGESGDADLRDGQGDTRATNMSLIGNRGSANASPLTTLDGCSENCTDGAHSDATCRCTDEDTIGEPRDAEGICEPDDAGTDDDFAATEENSCSVLELSQRRAIETKLLAAMERHFAAVSAAVDMALQSSDPTFAQDALRALNAVDAGMCPDNPPVQAAYWTKIYQALSFHQPSRVIGKTTHRMGERPAQRGRASTGYSFGTDRGRKRANDAEQDDRRRRQKGMTAEALLTTL